MMSALTVSSAVASISAGRPIQLREFAQEVALAVGNDMLVLTEMVVLAHGDPAGENNEKTRAISPAVASRSPAANERTSPNPRIRSTAAGSNLRNT
jgi:hypothetical protein